jgi:ribosome maturation factor RimP
VRLAGSKPPGKWAIRPLFFVLGPLISFLFGFCSDRFRKRASSPDERASKGPRGGGRHIYRDIPEPLRTLIEPVVEEHGCELVDVELTRPRGPGLLRVVVDSRAGDGRVPIEECASVSRELSTLLDATDFMPGAYRLEVSSPGLDRVLAREKDFEAAVSQEIRVQTRRPLEGRKRYRGRLVAFEAGVLKLNVDGDLASIPFDEVEKANTIYEFTRADFAKESAAGGSSQSGGM